MLSEAAVFLQKIRAYGDPRLFALHLVSEHFAKSSQPLVPERLFMAGGNGKNGGDISSGILGQLTGGLNGYYFSIFKQSLPIPILSTAWFTARSFVNLART